MSDMKLHKADFSGYDRMSTEELEDILCKHAESDGRGEPDLDAICYITEVLMKREQEKPAYDIPSVDFAWQQFQQKYLSEETGDSVPAAENPANPTETKKRKHAMRAAAAAVILAVVLVSTGVTASAFGVNLWEALANWTRETFGFSDAGKKDNGKMELPEQLQALNDILNQQGMVKKELLPRYIPEGYVSSEPVVSSYGYCTDVICMLSNAEKYIMLQYRLYTEGMESPTYEKDLGNPEKHIVGGVTHYITANGGSYQAVWRQGNIECFIYGLNTKEALIRMIDSIYGE